MNISRPSTTFTRNALIVSVVVGASLLGWNWWQHRNDTVDPNLQNQTISAVTGKDSNQNGIADWEERLWGLDPTVTMTDGVSNKELVEQRKKQLGVGLGTDKDLTETEKAARELFVVAHALGQTENIDKETLAEISKKIGTSIEIDTSDNVSLNDLLLVSSTRKNLEQYSQQFNTHLAAYKNMDSETSIIISSFENVNSLELEKLNPIALAYKNLSEQFAKMRVPVGIAEEHLGIINSLHRIAIALRLIANMESDAIKGAAGASLYNGASKAITIYSTSLNDYLKRYSIIKAQ